MLSCQITRSYISGETIVRRGQVITPLMIEALEVFGLVEPADSTHKTLAAISLIFLVGFFTALFVTQRSLPPLEDFRNLFLITVTFLIFLYGARSIIPNRVVIPYLFPLPAFGLVIASCIFCRNWPGFFTIIKYPRSLWITKQS